MDEMVQRLQQIQQRKAVVEEQRNRLLLRIQEITNSLVTKYGEDWQVKYEQAMAQLTDWERSNV